MKHTQLWQLKVPLLGMSTHECNLIMLSLYLSFIFSNFIVSNYIWNGLVCNQRVDNKNSHYNCIFRSHFENQNSSVCVCDRLMLTKQNTPLGLKIPKVHYKETQEVNKKVTKYLPQVWLQISLIGIFWFKNSSLGQYNEVVCAILTKFAIFTKFTFKKINGRLFFTFLWEVYTHKSNTFVNLKDQNAICAHEFFRFSRKVEFAGAIFGEIEFIFY